MPGAEQLRASAGRAGAAGVDWPWAFTRCWLLVEAFDRHGGDRGDLDAAMAAFATLPDGVPGRPRLAAMLVTRRLRLGDLDTPDKIDPLQALALIADGDIPPLPDWPLDRAVVRASWLMTSVYFGRAGVDSRTALEEIDELVGVVGSVGPQAQAIAAMRVFLTFWRGDDDGDLAAPGAVGDLLSGLVFDSAVDAQVGTLLAELASAAAQGDVSGVAALTTRLGALRHELPPDHEMRPVLDRAFTGVRSMINTITEGEAEPNGTAADLANLRAAAEEPGLHPTERAIRLSVLGMVEAGIGGGHLDDAVTHVHEAIELGGADDARRVLNLANLGWMLTLRYEERGEPSDLRRAVPVLAAARDLAGGPQHPDWNLISIQLGHAQRLAGRPAEGNRTGLDGLRGHAAIVLLQTRTADATTAARHAGADAIEVASWFLEDGDAGGAARALDTGRGLVLRASVQFGDVDARLRARGEHDLARRWHDAVRDGPADRAPIGLRSDVIASLSTAGPDGHEAALDPPEIPEVRAALARLGLDALVHLLLDQRGAAAAVIVPAADEPRWLPLPRLTLDAGTPLDTWLAQDTAHGLRGIGAEVEIDGPPPSGWRDELDRLCRWAWDTAVGPLLADLSGGAESPRVALVPMGPLARVPWHAAHDGHRYAVQRATFSYAVSARSLCDSAWAPAVPLHAGLVVGDPDTGRIAPALPAARLEALAIHESFYPTGRYVGCRADGVAADAGSGSRDDLAGWLADPGAGTVLHAACHGSVDATTAGASYLLLAGGSRLTAAELIRATATRRGRGLALVVLGACSTGVPGRNYDEAFSLATAFLAAGARTVISAMWKVPDDATSVLMFVVHHFLQTQRPLDALVAAQRWMLDPDRRVPDAMPPALRRHLASSDPTDVAAWAGFFHAGQS